MAYIAHAADIVRVMRMAKIIKMWGTESLMMARSQNWSPGDIFAPEISEAIGRGGRERGLDGHLGRVEQGSDGLLREQVTRVGW